MAARSIIDVEINDSAWKRFQKQVEDHRKTVKALPGQWGAVGKSVEAGVSAAARFVARVKEGAQQFKEANGFSGKMLLSMKASDRTASSLVRNTKNIAVNLKDATKSLLSWAGVMGLITGVLGMGGLFGIARMAQNVSAGQRDAMRSGSTYGGSKAAGIAYGQLLGGEGGVQSLLERIATEKESGGVMFARAGMGREKWEGKSPTDILGEYLKAVKESYANAPEGAQAKAMEAYAPEIDFNTIKQLSETNIDQLNAFYQAKQKELAVSVQTQSAWANFNRNLDVAGERLQNTFVNALVPLTPALTSFSEALNRAISTIMKHPMMQGLIKGAGKALQQGANYLMSDQFSKDFKSFMEEIRKIGQAVVDTATFLNKWLGTETPEEGAARVADQFGGPRRTIELGGQSQRGQQGDNRIGKVHLTHEFTHRFIDPAGNNIPAQTYATASGRR